MANIADEKILARRKQSEAKLKLLERVSLAYWVEGRDQNQIAERLQKKRPSSVSRLLSEAKELGVITFVVDTSFGMIGDENKGLGSDLADEFRLREATVIDVNVRMKYDTDEDMYLHKVLANRSGLKVARSLLPEDHVAVGGGRAVLQAARFIARRHLSKRALRFTPLCGRVWARPRLSFVDADGGPQIKRPLDADDVAFVLAESFAQDAAGFSQIAHPLFAPTAAKAHEIMKDRQCPFKPDGSWAAPTVSNWKPPNRALVGVGVVDPSSGHRFAYIGRRAEKISPEMDPYLSHVIPVLKAIIQFVEKRKLPYPGDVTNELFPVLPLPSQLRNVKNLQQCASDYIKILELADQLNRKRVGVNWKHLRAIPSILAIAGGQLKLAALFTLALVTLEIPSKSIINEVCTDMSSAKALLKEREIYRHLETKNQNWYRELLDKIF